MKITCLVENTREREDLGCEHGLSFYIEAGENRLLFDMGAGGLFLENAEKMGIDLSGVDLAFLSHGHADHGGGLNHFLEINDHGIVYIKQEAFGEYYSQKVEGPHYIGLLKELEGHPQVRLVEPEIFAVKKGILLFSGVKERRMFPESNRNLKEKTENGYEPDRFLHEQNLILEEGGKTVLFAGCAHNGILNILERSRTAAGKIPNVVIGGFHLNSPTVGAVGPEYIKKLAEELLDFDCVYYTCHCTGETAYDGLREVMGDRIRTIRGGGRLNI